MNPKNPFPVELSAFEPPGKILRLRDEEKTAIAPLPTKHTYFRRQSFIVKDQPSDK
ncbi:MAG: hypothetical protein MUF49_16010 [Oculatellaceae cyanobacterium Prado106]|jgi:hypothetical protein|nr:hypothetical protein [Oculatellaceae cyanobacterium Prado106]